MSERHATTTIRRSQFQSALLPILPAHPSSSVCLVHEHRRALNASLIYIFIVYPPSSSFLDSRETDASLPLNDSLSPLRGFRPIQLRRFRIQRLNPDHQLIAILHSRNRRPLHHCHDEHIEKSNQQLAASETSAVLPRCHCHCPTPAIHVPPASSLRQSHRAVVARPAISISTSISRSRPRPLCNPAAHDNSAKVSTPSNRARQLCRASNRAPKNPTQSRTETPLGLRSRLVGAA